MELHKPGQTTRFAQLPHLLDLGFTFSLILIISPQVDGVCIDLGGEAAPQNMDTEEIPPLLQPTLDHSSEDRRAGCSVRWLFCTSAKSWLLLTSGRLDLVLQYRFKVLPVHLCNELGIHSTDVSFTKTKSTTNNPPLHSAVHL